MSDGQHDIFTDLWRRQGSECPLPRSRSLPSPTGRVGRGRGRGWGRGRGQPNVRETRRGGTSGGTARALAGGQVASRPEPCRVGRLTAGPSRAEPSRAGRRAPGEPAGPGVVGSGGGAVIVTVTS